jgi:hypothetical protein
MNKYTWNNNFHTLPMYRDCECSFSQRLEAKENTKQEVRYQYECLYSKCKAITKVEEGYNG